MTCFNFTKSTIEGLPLPEVRQVRHRDARVPGLVVVVFPTGRRAFYWYRKVDGRPVELLLGEFPAMTVENARTKAQAHNVERADGVRPGRKRRESVMTFGELFAWYADTHGRQRKRSWRHDEWLFGKHLGTLAGLPLDAIDRGEMRTLHVRMGEEAGPYMANKAIALVRAIFNRAARAEVWGGANPAIGLDPFPEQTRDRRLMPAELPAFFAAVDEAEPDIRHAIYLLLYTGARKSNVLAMQWDEIDWSARSWRIPLTKSGTPQTVALHELAIAVLDERRLGPAGATPWVFPGRGGVKKGHIHDIRNGWVRVLERAGIADGDLHIHDLRRTLGSFMVDTGATLAVIGQALHHQDQQTTAIYARLRLDPVRDAQARAIAAMMERGEGGKDVVGQR